MKCEIDGGIIVLDCPEGFDVMTAQDYHQLGGYSKGNDWGAVDRDLHLAYNISWRAPSVFEKLFASNMTLENMVDNTLREYKKLIATFTMGKKCSRKIADEDAVGFRYSYVAKNTNMTSEYLLIKHNKKYYAFICLGRTANFEEHYHLFEEMLESVQLL